MMRNLLIISVVFLFAGCATTKGYQQLVDAWVGGNEQALLESPRWGVPDKSFKQANGNTVYCYVIHRVVSTPTQIHTNPNGRATVVTGSIVERECETCFYLNSDLIIYHYTFKGNDCLAREQS